MHPAFRLVVFLLVSGGLFAAAHVYLYRRWGRDVWASRSARRAVALVLALAGVIAVTVPPGVHLSAQFTAAPRDPGLARAAMVAVMAWGGFVLGSSAVLLLLQLLSAIARAVRAIPAEPVSETRRLFLARAAAGTSVLVAGVSSGYGYHRALGPPEVTDVPVRLPRLPRALSGLTLVQLSDLHIGALLQEEFVDRVVELTNGLKPDAVVITGDLVDGPVHRLGRFVARLQRLRSRYGTFFVTGNHDYYSGADVWCHAVEGLGFQVLRNRRVTLGDAGASLDLLGVDDWGSRKSGRGYDLRAAMAGRDPERASVLLAHQPANFEVVSQAGIGLQLSGHTHGGQVFPFTRLVGVAWPWSRGLHTLGNSSIYVSRGTGFVGPPMRTDSPPEIARIVLVS